MKKTRHDGGSDSTGLTTRNFNSNVLLEKIIVLKIRTDVCGGINRRQITTKFFSISMDVLDIRMKIEQFQ